MKALHIVAPLIVSAALAAPASADQREVVHFADPFDGSAQCTGFVNNWEGHDRGTITNFSRDGVLYRQVGHIHAIETDTNSVTGKSVVIRTELTVLGDLTPDGELSGYKISGQFNVGTSPSQGIVIHDAGTVTFDSDGMITAIHGIHNVFDSGEDAFCAALA